MEEITGYRGSGKTVELVRKANLAYDAGKNVIVLVTYNVQEDVYRRYGLDIHIPVMNFGDYMQKRQTNEIEYKSAEIYIDEVHYFLEDILGNRVACITTEMKDQVVVSRDNWNK